MQEIILKQTAIDGQPLEVRFASDAGMNLLHYSKGTIQVLDQSTKVLFEDRYAGLGALIGPHFHHRNPACIPAIKDESLFPHIARVRAKGINEPFSHGIARYAPWKVEKIGEAKLKGRLTGKDEWNGVSLAALEGQNFTYDLNAELTPHGLVLDLAVVSDTDSVVGIHYYYAVPRGKGTVESLIHREGKEEKFVYEIGNAIDSNFHPAKPLEGKIDFNAGDYRVVTRYQSPSQENSWQLFHPEGASYICIEPLSAADPRHPVLTASRLKIHIEII